MKIVWVCNIYDCLHSKFHMSSFCVKLATVLLNGKLNAVIVQLPCVALQKNKLLNVDMLGKSVLTDLLESS